MILIIAAVLLLPFSVSAAEKSDKTDIYSGNNILKFTNELFERSEYQRVIYELDRYDYFYNNYESNVNVTRLLCQERLGFEFIKDGNDSGDIVTEIIYLDYLNRKKVEYRLPNTDFIKEKETERIYYKRIFLNRLLANDFNGAEKIIADYDLPVTDFNEIDRLYNNFKSPYVGLLSAVIPGGGYIYAGNPRTGLTAFAVIGIFFTASYFAHNYDSDYIAVASGTIGTLFYGGSIFGGYMESVRYNKNLQDEIIKYAEYHYGFETDRNYLFRTYGTGGISLKF
ncbi:MAG: hypothetical protein JW982_10250 [Spirochaetes bacterium]|nr:hypothetical protein [Spirochaetota bacterium]